MALTANEIRNAQSDEALLKLLQAELNRMFPPDSRRKPETFLIRLQHAPRGLRAMAATFELDVSMALDDLAWHFVNHPNLPLYEEAHQALEELEALEAAALFQQAFAAIKPHCHELSKIVREHDSGGVHNWLDMSGIQATVDPLNKQMWKLLGQWPNEGLMHYWISYARKYPDQCVGDTKALT